MINQIFIEIENAIKLLQFLSKKYNNGETFFSSNISNYYEEDEGYIECEEATRILGKPLVWMSKNPDERIKFSIFHTENKYLCNSSSYEKEIQEKTEWYKPFFKNENIEVGLTLKGCLLNPTDTCWGYKFSYPKYYIIKDGVETISDERSTIRKVYHGKSLETSLNIRIEDKTSKPTKSFELDNWHKISKNLYGVEFNNEEYLAATDDTIWKYVDEKTDDETLIHLLGGTDEIVKSYLSGHQFDKRNFLFYNYKLEDFNIEDDPEGLCIKNCSVIELEGLYLYKIL